MPTENRSTMISVPRELLERCCMRPRLETRAVNHQDIIDRGRAQAELREILAQPAQHQGEPVVSPCALCCQTHEQVPVGRVGGQQANGCDVDFTTWRCEGCGGSWTGDPADPGEVERLRNCLKIEIGAGDSWKREAQELRIQLAEQKQIIEALCEGTDGSTTALVTIGRLQTQLAERDALLDEAWARLEPFASAERPEVGQLCARIEAALSASAEHSVIACHVDESCGQSAPVERDERAELELALSEYGKITGMHVLPDGFNVQQDAFVRGFIARAALERKP